MHPSSFEQSNIVLGPPEGMSEDDCGSLSAYRGHLEDGSLCTVSCFKVTPAELASIQRDGRVWLVALGWTIPPVKITGLNPFEEEELTPSQEGEPA